jgi:hypothetical protein
MVLSNYIRLQVSTAVRGTVGPPLGMTPYRNNHFDPEEDSSKFLRNVNNFFTISTTGRLGNKFSTNYPILNKIGVDDMSLETH